MIIPMLDGILKNQTISIQSFVGKDQMISMVNNFKYHVMKDRIFNGFVTNQNGWLMYTGEFSLDDFQNTDQFTGQELENIKNRLDNLCSRLSESGIKLIIVVPPNKNTIYPEYMPSEISRMNKESRLDQVMSIWNDSDYCTMVDLRPTLFEAKKNNQVYYSTDTHWNPYGAFLAYQELAKILKEDYPAVKVRPISYFPLEPSLYNGDLTGKDFGHFNLEEETDAIQYDSHSNFSPCFHQIPGVVDIINTYPDDSTLPKAIFYRDSFYTGVYPFLCENFSDASYFWSNNIDFDLVNLKKPDYLILEVAERYLGNAMFSIPEPK
ncbi:MAG: hypothetical protein MUO60_02770 [Clostridiaceae bacterium]|nr:hypothetical protein [Clostridiaceae bacterium]